MGDHFVFNAMHNDLDREQLVPVVGRMATLQHLAKNTVGIVAAVIRASGVVVIEKWLRKFGHWDKEE